jgi:VWFA-related protein
MQEGDLVALVRTAAAWGALQQLTTDRRVLHSAIDQIRWTALSRRGVGSFKPVNDWLHTSTAETGGGTVSTGFDKADPLDMGQADDLREDMSASATLGAIVFAIDGVRSLPGRKAVVLVSEGFLPPEPNGPDDRVMRQMNRLTDMALRTGTVIYGLDPRGLVSGGLTAEDNIKVGGAKAVEVHGIGRRKFLLGTQDAMATLAERTGGRAILNSNDVAGGLRRIGDDLRGYYIIGYNPPEGTFAEPGKTPRFHKLSLKVRRPGVRVRTREGFLGESDAAPRAASTPEEQLRAAAISPFAAIDIPLRATLVPGYDAEHGMSVRAMLHIDARALTFTEDPSGARSAKVGVIGVVTDEWGVPQSQRTATFTATLDKDDAQRALDAGIVASMVVPATRAGGFQVRFAVRDNASGAMGSASQFVEIPDIHGGTFALSGIVLGEESVGLLDEEGAAPAPTSGPALRVFTPGTRLVYAYEVYNAGAPANACATVWRDGQPVFTTPPATLAIPANARASRAAGGIRLGHAMPPGDYVFEVSVIVPGKKGKVRAATQATSFEVRAR